LKAFRGEDHDVKEDIHEMREEQMQMEAEPPWTMKQLLKAKKLRFPLLLLCGLQAGQQLSGINVVSAFNAVIISSQLHVKRVLPVRLYQTLHAFSVVTLDQ
jgi:hypothetical protein